MTFGRNDRVLFRNICEFRVYRICCVNGFEMSKTFSWVITGSKISKSKVLSCLLDWMSKYFGCW